MATPASTAQALLQSLTAAIVDEDYGRAEQHLALLEDAIAAIERAELLLPLRESLASLQQLLQVRQQERREQLGIGRKHRERLRGYESAAVLGHRI